MKFIDEFDIESRKREANKIILKHPTRIPIIVEKHKSCEFQEINKKKYLVPKDMTMNQFIYIIRKRIDLQSSQSLFVTVNNNLAPTNRLLGDIYEDNANEDGFLYMIYTSENTFG